ncbi:hypothetical protein [Metasolibacillus meyeri]|uniref:phage lytic cycle repressor MrpR family protein n=1 Tax=Metasolibacillus meyeri TaxID=1071052 RepID=UPI000D2FBFD3|nr:hypothetical protein [Metasolibacillus meyeri]
MTTPENLFNEEVKQYFIAEFPEESIKRHQAMGLFKNAKLIEERLGIDLYDMPYSELDKFLLGNGYKSSNSVVRDIVLLNQYIKWAELNGLVTNQTNRLFSTSRKSIEKYIYKNFNTIYRKEDIVNGLKQENDLYYLIGLCLFEGIGSVNFEEIQTLTVDQLAENNSEYFIRLNRGLLSISEELYQGLMQYDKVCMDKNLHSEFVDSEYIFKPFKRKNSDNKLVIHPAIRNRMWNALKECLGDETFNLATVVRSSFSYYAYIEMKKSNNMLLTTEILKQIADRHGKHKNIYGYYLGKILDELNIKFMKESYGDFKIEDKILNKI